MKTKLITALRTCANALEQGTFEYNWLQPQSCNCGIVACALMGKSVAGMAELLRPMKDQVDLPNWKYLVGKFCPVTGVPENEVFRTLIEAGMTQTDIIELEELANHKVLSRIELQPAYVSPSLVNRLLPWRKYKRASHYVSKANAIAYMRAWADLLTEEGSLDVASPEPQQVNCPNR